MVGLQGEGMAYTARTTGVSAPHPKLIVFGIVAAGLVGVLVLAARQESLSGQAAVPAATAAPQPVPRVLTQQEQAYAEAL